ncbi:M48 family metallopeptidase [Helicovermis profundi]|uniref:M48 family metallopeptidase n=1 Tax=Helicovermis profundi TaxID=3065157 RepID=A0AAU9E7X8_9FIRM|nr:M48 family metallopeptidase [Clostridia bacterium S502]
MQIVHNEEIIEFSVKYSKRKSLLISVIPTNEVKVTAPLGVSEELIKDNVRKKADWILKKINQFNEIDFEKIEKKYVNNEIFLYLGKDYFLQIKDDVPYKKAKAKLKGDNIIIYTPSNDKQIIKKAVEDWYRKRTKEKLVERINYYQKYFDVYPIKIVSKIQKRRWGTCTSKREIYFNLKCAMLPMNIFDYVVVHELCHMVHMNHKEKYWSLVESIIPDYKERKEWLKINGHKIEL